MAIASEVNECNEILLTEMVIRGFFNDLGLVEIGCLLTIFITEKDGIHLDVYQSGADQREIDTVSTVQCELDTAIRSQTDIIYEHSKSPLQIRECLQRVAALIRELDPSELNSNDHNDWSIHLDMMVPVFMWLSYDPDVTDYIDIYCGNFIKNMIKLCHLGETVSKMANRIEDYLLVRKLADLEQIVMRGVVTVNSLYVNNI
ncbi:MAG: hypothetical protein HYT75_05525 [Deltaproteobacteria bacterium]|nr:hypothetical protein [Deltaproteobacteria bacterium]